MSNVIKHIKSNGHGYKHGRSWNMAHLLPKPKPIPATPAAEPASAETLNIEPGTLNPPMSNPPATLNLEPETLNHPRTRVGKIARLSHEIREEINEMLRSGYKYTAIRDKLDQLGHPGMNASNISAWKHGGYVDWLREKQRQEQALALPLALERCTRHAQIDRMQQNALIVGISQLSEVLVGFDIAHARQLLNERPELLPKFLASLTSLSRCNADLAKTFDQVHGHEQTLRAQLGVPGCPTPADLSGDSEVSSVPSSRLDLPLVEPEFTRIDLNAVKPVQGE